MKKLVCLLLIAALTVCGIFALVACNNNDGKVVTVGYTIYEPMNYQDKDGNLVGFDTELAKMVFEDLGYTVVFKEITWNKKYVDLNSGNIDCIWNGFTSNSSDDGTARADLVDFSYNYMKNYQAIVVNSASAASYTDKTVSFDNKVGYVEDKSAGAEYAATLTGATVKTANTQMDAIMQVKSGAADFAVVDYLLANSIVGTGDFSNLAFVAALNSDVEYYGIGFKKGSDLTAKVNAKLEEYAANGKLLTLATKYELTNAVITDYTDQKNA